MEESKAIFINNKIYNDEPEILGVQYKLNKGYDLFPTGIINEPTLVTIKNYQGYYNPKNIRERKRFKKKRRN